MHLCVHDLKTYIIACCNTTQRINANVPRRHAVRIAPPACVAHRSVHRMAWGQGLVEALYRKAIAPEQADGTAAAALLEKAAAQVRLPDEGRPAQEAARPKWDQPVEG